MQTEREANREIKKQRGRETERGTEGEIDMK